MTTETLASAESEKTSQKTSGRFTNTLFSIVFIALVLLLLSLGIGSAPY